MVGFPKGLERKGSYVVITVIFVLNISKVKIIFYSFSPFFCENIFNIYHCSHYLLFNCEEMK